MYLVQQRRRDNKSSILVVLFGINSMELHRLHWILNVENRDWYSEYWKLVVAATLWTIWLCRNECIFNQKRTRRKIIETLIFTRMNKWGLATQILDFGNEPLWRVNPHGAINIHFHLMGLSFWKFEYEL